MLKLATTSSDSGLRWAQCRSLGHKWDHKGILRDSDKLGYSKPWSVEAGAVPVRSVCDYCGTERVKWMTRSGMAWPGRYTYPDDYSRTGENKLSNQEWRHEWVVSMLGDEPALAIIGARGRKRAAS